MPIRSQHLDDVHNAVRCAAQYAFAAVNKRDEPAGVGLRVDQARKEILDVVHIAINHQIRVYHNSNVPINRVPTDISTAIFAPLRFHDRVLATHVCRHWRSTMLSTPTLWNDISLTGCAIRGLPELLERSASALISIALHIVPNAMLPSAYQRCYLHLRNALTRIGCLTLKFDRDVQNRHFWQLATALNGQAPGLRRLSVIAPSMDLAALENIFDRSAPQLEHLTLTGIELKANHCWALRRIVALDFSFPDLHQRDIAFILHEFPHLKQLKLAFEAYEAPNDHLSRMCDVSELQISSGLGTTDLLKDLCHNSIRTIICSGANFATASTLIRRLENVTRLHIPIRGKNVTLVAEENNNMRGYRRELPMPEATGWIAALQFLGSTTETLVELHIGVVEWGRVAGLVAPCLLDLTIELTSRAAAELRQTSMPPVRCPALSTVRFLTCIKIDGTLAPRVPGAVIAAFVRSNLSFRTSLLSALWLDRVVVRDHSALQGLTRRLKIVTPA